MGSEMCIRDSNQATVTKLTLEKRCEFERRMQLNEADGIVFIVVSWSSLMIVLRLGSSRVSCRVKCNC